MSGPRAQVIVNEFVDAAIDDLVQKLVASGYEPRSLHIDVGGEVRRTTDIGLDGEVRPPSSQTTMTVGARRSRRKENNT